MNLIGRLGADPEIQFYESGKCKARVGIALDEGKDKPPSWVQIEAWGTTAEILSNYCRKGNQIGVSGRLKQDRRQDQATGQNRSFLYVVAGRVTLLSSKDGEQDGMPQELVAAGTAAAARAKAAATPTPAPAPVPQPDYSDIPF
ncbi:MAG: single-stranded DNA-binding protein [Cyanobacteria bacterium P01_A01_bin.17]